MKEKHYVTLNNRYKIVGAAPHHSAISGYAANDNEQLRASFYGNS
jgi:hypothetical protein